MSWRARHGGEEHPCSPHPGPEGLQVRLRSEVARPGWDEVAPGTWVLAVPAQEVEALLHVRTVGRWRGEDWLVVDDLGEDLLLEHLGGADPVARAAGATRVDRGVWHRRVPREEVRSVRESQTLVEV